MQFRHFALVLILISGSMAVTLGYAQDKQSSVAVVDMDKVFEQYQQRKEATDQLLTKKEELLKLVKAKESELSRLQLQFEQKKSTWTASEFRQKLIEIESRKEELRVLIDKSNQELSQLEESLKKSLIKQIYVAIEKVRLAGHYDVVLEKKQLVAFRIDLDLTDQVLLELNSK